MDAVEMWGIPKKPCNGKQNRYFDCGYDFWEAMLKLGKMHGWKPRGTLPDDVASLREAIKCGFFETDYRPHNYGYRKMVLFQDAANWAAALENAVSGKSSPKTLGEELIEKNKVVALSSDNMTEWELSVLKFVSWLKQGGFGLAYYD